MTANSHNYQNFKAWYAKLKDTNFKAFAIMAADQAGRVRFICHYNTTAGDCLPLIKEMYLNIQNQVKGKEGAK